MKDKSFKPENASQYELSLQVDRGMLSYGVFDPGRRQYVVFRSHGFQDAGMTEDLPGQLAGIFLQDGLLDLPFRRIRLIYYTQFSTLVPDPYFDEAHARDFFAFNHFPEPGDEIFSNFIPSIGAWNVFSVPSPVVSVIADQFKKGVLMHQATPFLLPGPEGPRQQDYFSVNIGINRDFFDIAVFHENRLQLYTAYPYAGETDLLYYVLYVYKEMGLAPDTVPLFLSGEMSTKLLYYDTLKQYIPCLSYANAADTFAFAPSLYSVSVHKYLNLLTLHNCVSSVENTREGELR